MPTTSWITQNIQEHKQIAAAEEQCGNLYTDVIEQSHLSIQNADLFPWVFVILKAFMSGIPIVSPSKLHFSVDGWEMMREASCNWNVNQP